MVKVIADTSFLMIPGVLMVDILTEMERLLEGKPELVVPTPVLRELERLSAEGKPGEKSAARIALEIARRGKPVEADEPADEAILKLAGKLRCPVGTADANLRKELRRRGLPVVYLRGESHLTMDGRI
jgi:rRNA-processing protein FCF1